VHLIPTPGFIAVAKAIRTKPNTETLIPQSFPFCLVTERVEVLPSALCLLLYTPFFTNPHNFVETFRLFALAQLGVSLAWCAAANVSTTKKGKGNIVADLI
jgi:hypothetical protein